MTETNPTIADIVEARFPGPVSIKGGNDSFIVLIAATVNFAIGVPAALAGIVPLWPVLAIAGFFFFMGYGSMWMFPSAVELSSVGLTTRCGPWRYTRAWDTVGNFTTDEKLKSRWQIVVHEDTNKGQPLMRLVAKPFKRDALLGTKSGLSAADFATLLNLWREKALRSQD